MIQEHCTEQLPQVQLQQLNISSEEESVPEDSYWSSDVSEIEEPTSPQPLMTNQPSEGPTVTEIPDPDDQGDETVNQPAYQPHHPQTSTSAASNGRLQTFTLDDIPPSQWRDIFQDFKAFLVL
ncbi:hypothetical protein TIFTF001_027833 [Ficus carica]|uniref:Uncharacterized protein n=1 Tax=Ficus carica TaxID=3494 RepID=A0AA88J0T8_FICCA|nr:hypothetical protein TIFTF001_027833 [Ficus carica]